MKSIEKANYNQQQIKFEKKNNSSNKILDRQTNAKTFNEWIQVTIGLFKKDDKIRTESYSTQEVINLLETIKRKYSEFNQPIREELERVQGKSSFEYKEYPELIEVITYRDKKPVTTELAVSDINYIENMIKTILKHFPRVESKKIALLWAKDTKKETLTWNEFFSNRKYHNYFTICLRYLRKKKIINYQKGIISLR